MALDALRCNRLAPLGFKGLKYRNELRQQVIIILHTSNKSNVIITSFHVNYDIVDSLLHALQHGSKFHNKAICHSVTDSNLQSTVGQVDKC